MGHGQIEVRTRRTITGASILRWLDPDGVWGRLGCVAEVEGERHIDSEATRHTRYNLFCLPGNANQIAMAMRGCWGIET